MALNEGVHRELDQEKFYSYASQSMIFIDQIINNL
ncbi:hypothetical protein SIID45300_02675 [Candidatus Magnetaquicoccaceae bacterium FCR-1]|uniref:Uncharacterized protein n=1 Tax=Candidatus Magnetaquiglobus chichijimensis TaxID=3141448 RepID=A0ABQ0CBR9_9PROT